MTQIYWGSTSHRTLRIKFHLTPMFTSRNSFNKILVKMLLNKGHLLCIVAYLNTNSWLRQ